MLRFNSPFLLNTNQCYFLTFLSHTECPIILVQSAIISDKSHSDNEDVTPCRRRQIVGPPVCCSSKQDRRSMDPRLLQRWGSILKFFDIMIVRLVTTKYKSQLILFYTPIIKACVVIIGSVTSV